MTVVLLIGAGGAAANSVVRALRMAGGYMVVGVDSDPYTIMLSAADERHLLPNVDDPRYPGLLAELADHVDADVVHAQPEAAVLSLARHRGEVRGTWMLPDVAVLEVCDDKFRSAQAFLESGVPHPRTFLVRDHDTLAVAFDRLHGRVWLRSRWGAGGAGAIVTSKFQEACWWVDRHGGWGAFTAAAVIPGDSYAHQSMWVDGRLVVGQSKRRVRWANGRNTPTGVGGSSAVSETVSHPMLAEVAAAAVRAVDPRPHGLFGVDMVWDGGVCDPMVTEVNAGRFHTTVDMLAAAGLNLPDRYMQLAAATAAHHPGVPVVDPLDDGVLWIRGMDCEPVMVSRHRLESPVAEGLVAA